MENSDVKIPKGYRLRVSTHRLISQLVNYTGSDYDTIISTACLLLEKEINYIINEDHTSHLKNRSEEIRLILKSVS
ncbi:MAG: hypothetical protein N2510_08800 [Ignavibacteria bacterium]|nr:hypothetical protein [Ignavibacteria bacterium]